MILLLAVIAGLLAGLARAWRASRPLVPPDLRLVWLALLAFLPQWLAFYLPATRRLFAQDLAAAALVSTQVFLLAFAWFNREQSGFWALGFGLALNLLVITLNGGLMPISPETAAQLRSGTSSNAWQIGQRLGTSKDIILPIAATRLWWLSDRFLLPNWFPYRVAFSLGDVFIAGGAFMMAWALGRDSKKQGEKFDYHKTAAYFRYPTQRQRTEPVDKCSHSKQRLLPTAVDQPDEGVDSRL